MSLRYTIRQQDALIRVKTEGTFDFLDAYEMWEKIAAACVRHDCYRILGFSNLDEALSNVDAYEYLGILESVGVGARHRIAWVAQKPKLLNQLRLAESVIRNRSPIDVRAFANPENAMRWLESGV